MNPIGINLMNFFGGAALFGIAERIQTHIVQLALFPMCLPTWLLGVQRLFVQILLGETYPSDRGHPHRGRQHFGHDHIRCNKRICCFNVWWDRNIGCCHTNSALLAPAGYFVPIHLRRSRHKRILRQRVPIVTDALDAPLYGNLR